MAGKGAAYLAASFETLASQTLSDFEIVVSDQSSDGEVEALCKAWQPRLNIQHVRFDTGLRQASANVNNAVRHAKSPLIKILFQDDLMVKGQALQAIVDAFDDPKIGWVLCGSGVTRDSVSVEKPIVPRLTSKLHYGKNSVSSPSVLAFRNTQAHWFDESLQWLMDVAFYKELWLALGDPAILPDTLVLNRLHPGQVCARITPQLRRDELAYVRRKFRGTDGLAATLDYHRQTIKAR